MFCFNHVGEDLLAFKSDGFHDSLGTVNNWKVSDEDSCHWKAVSCNPRKHVIGL